MTALLPVDEARTRILKDARPIRDTEEVSLHDAGDRKLAADVTAARSQPPFAASAMDGYAVRAADLDPLPCTLQVIGEAPAGHGFAGTVEAGQAVRIFTSIFPAPRFRRGPMRSSSRKTRSGLTTPPCRSMRRPQGAATCATRAWIFHGVTWCCAPVSDWMPAA